LLTIIFTTLSNFQNFKKTTSLDTVELAEKHFEFIYFKLVEKHFVLIYYQE